MIIQCPECNDRRQDCPLCHGMGDVSVCVKCQQPIEEGAGRYRSVGGNDTCPPCWEVLPPEEKARFV